MSLDGKSQTCAFVFEHRSKLTHALLQTGELYCGCLAHFLGIFVSGKGGIRLICEENPITSIRWTTKFVRVRRISDYNRSRNSVRVERISDLNKSNLGEVYCILLHLHLKW